MLTEIALLIITITDLEKYFFTCVYVPSTDEKVEDVGPLEADKSEIREDPYSLPNKFKWDCLDLDNDQQVYDRYITDRNSSDHAKWSLTILNVMTCCNGCPSCCKELSDSWHTVNRERFAGLNFCIFRGFQEHHESFSMNIHFIYTSFI